MEDLETSLRKVEDLRRDLSAEIVVQDEESHIEQKAIYDVTGSRDGAHAANVEYIDENIIDKPRITKPDTQKREAARQALQQLYGYSEWYSARYSAGKELGQTLQIKEKVNLWLADLVKRVNEKKDEKIEATEKVQEEAFVIFAMSQYVLIVEKKQECTIPAQPNAKTARKKAEENVQVA